MPVEALKRSHTVTSFEPFTLLSALSQVTESIGLVATGSTTFDAPYHIARRFASLDHLSGGRAGWNIVTTSNPDAALNFGMDELMEHGERYERAREFYDVVTGLWDSWADDAFIRDAESGIFLDPAKMHVLGHKGEFLSVRGPLNIARPVQGWPVIVQAGASDAGRRLASETAEAVFTSVGDIAAGRAFYADVKGRMEKLGRAREHMKILPACLVVVGETKEQAQDKRAKLDSLVNSANAIASLSIALGHDASRFDPDGPLPEIPESNQSKSGRERAIALAKRDNLTVRQIAWLQAYELLHTGALVWPRLEPTNGEIRALCNQQPTAEMRRIFDRVRNQWGDATHILGIDLSYLKTAANEPGASHPFKDYHVHMHQVMERNVQVKLVKRVSRRFGGCPRKASIDSDIAYLLGITRQYASFLRRSVKNKSDQLH